MGWTRGRRTRILIGIPEDAPAEVVESERLARRWFALVQDRSFEHLMELVHEDVVLVSKVRPGLVIEGREQLGSFIADTIMDSLYEAVTDVYRPLDDERVVVEGRLRWIDEERVIRDDPVIWAMEFRDGLLARFVPARTAIEAETILRAGSTPVG